MRRISLLWVGMFFLFLSANAQHLQPITQFAVIRQLVDANRFEMSYTIATTHYTFSLQSTTPYSDQNIRIAQDSAFIIIQDSVAAGYLPYFGTGYSMPQTGAKGIVFSNKMQDLTKSLKGRGRRQSIAYQFSVVGKNDTYKVSIDIRSNGQCYLFINSLRRSPISYIGQVVEKVQ
ncbi:MAG: DUF4251 domain-containing protein [Odoribacter sp.]